MDICEFEQQMKTILRKASEASEMSLEWQLVSGDPDCVADFGCDHEGCLVISGESFPLKICDMTGIRYRYNSETDYSDCFYRFDFGNNIHLDCCFSDCETGHMYHVKYNDTYETCLDRKRAIKLIRQCSDKTNLSSCHSMHQ